MNDFPLPPAEVLKRLRRPGPALSTVSGVLTTRPGMIVEVDSRLPAVQVITTKSYQLKPNPGNPEPVIVEAGVGNFGNSVGLRNPGMRQGLVELKELRTTHKLRALLNVSISGSSPEEFAQLAEHFSEVADLIELNLSCPHAAPGYGMSIGTDPQLVAEYVAAVRAVTDRPIFPKLTPNVEDIAAIARAAVTSGADGISAVNTVGPEIYHEPHSGAPVLNNPRGNRGGKSGAWIAEIARTKVAEIRQAVGSQIPIIGIGGVSNGRDVYLMMQAGANIVGLGSVFARIAPADWRSFTDSLLQEAAEYNTASVKHHRPLSEKYLKRERLMEYQAYQVRSIESGGHGTFVLELDRSLDFSSSQFAFLWLPGIGEKPFSIAHSEPATFFIKDRGRVSHAISQLSPGDTIYARGVYGKKAPLSQKPQIYILTGGTGIAVATKLAQELTERGSLCSVYYATSHEDNILIPPGLDDAAAQLHIIPDSGLPARAVRQWKHDMLLSNADMASAAALYCIGPPDFMRRAVEAAEQAGIPSDETYLSVETATHCGVGLCGECECGGRLTCQEGTFFTKGFFDRKGISITSLPNHHSLSTIGVNN